MHVFGVSTFFGAVKAPQNLHEHIHFMNDARFTLSYGAEKRLTDFIHARFINGIKWCGKGKPLSYYFHFNTIIG